MERRTMLIFLEMLESDEERLSFQEVYEKNYMKMFYAALIWSITGIWQKMQYMKHS